MFIRSVIYGTSDYQRERATLLNLIKPTKAASITITRQGERTRGEREGEREQRGVRVTWHSIHPSVRPSADNCDERGGREEPGGRPRPSRAGNRGIEKSDGRTECRRNVERFVVRCSGLPFCINIPFANLFALCSGCPPDPPTHSTVHDSVVQ